MSGQRRGRGPRTTHDACTGELPEDVPQIPELMREDVPWPSRSGKSRSAGSRSRGKKTGATRSTSPRPVDRSSS